MKWPITKKVWNLAKLAHPNESIWIDVPFVLNKAGEMAVSVNNKPSGAVKYETLSLMGRTIIRLSYKGVMDEVIIPSIKKISAKGPKSTDFKKASESQPLAKRLSSNYSKDEINKIAAQIFLESGLKDLKKWSTDNGFDSDTEINSVLSSIVISKEQKKRKFKMNDRVRVIQPNSMEFGEMATILEVHGDYVHGYEYLVLVDASSLPIMVKHEFVQENLAGGVNEQGR